MLVAVPIGYDRSMLFKEGPGPLPANDGRTVWPLVAIGQKGSAVCDPRGFPVPLGIATNNGIYAIAYIRTICLR
ncbi:MAG: hypothetical protein CR994_09645 [Maribacter sp.]|nr:MAG: hypothetical protein CR994_09645 [Maribacter sp.]